jgi:hypothetical protein
MGKPLNFLCFRDFFSSFSERITGKRQRLITTFLVTSEAHENREEIATIGRN